MYTDFINMSDEILVTLERMKKMLYDIQKDKIEGMMLLLFMCLVDFILYVPVNNLSVMSGRVFLG